MMSAVGGVLGAARDADGVADAARPAALRAGLCGGNFLYIAMADLIPDLHRGNVDGGALRQMALIGAGILTIVLL